MSGITTAAIGAATSLYSVGSGIKQKMDAKEALANLKTPEYQNPSEKIKISTAGSDLIREEGQRTQANILNSLQGGSARNIFSAIPGLMAMNNNINQKAGLNIDNQMQKREYAIAASQERLNAIEENRYQGEIAGIGNMYNQGNQQMWNGIRGTISAAGTLGRAMDNRITEPPRPRAKMLSGLTPLGVQDVVPESNIIIPNKY